MSADFYAGWVSGAAGIFVGNPLDVLKVQLQSGQRAALTISSNSRYAALIRGATAPILGYGALNALLFVSYNRALFLLDPSIANPIHVPDTALAKVWAAGAAGGLASWIVSAPTELIKCRTQLSRDGSTSWQVARYVWRKSGFGGFYVGGAVTSARDAIGYGFYFWTYESCKRIMLARKSHGSGCVTETLLCGGVAGVVTWASIYPLDSIKTRLQSPERPSNSNARSIALQMYHHEGGKVFFRGLGVCSSRAFVVNAVQWAVYEWAMRALASNMV